MIFDYHKLSELNVGIVYKMPDHIINFDSVKIGRYTVRYEWYSKVSEYKTQNWKIVAEVHIDGICYIDLYDYKFKQEFIGIFKFNVFEFHEE